jgi:hypothetical protein
MKEARVEGDGFVLEVRGKAGETDCFAAVYEALADGSLAEASWFAWCETQIVLPRRLSKGSQSELIAARWDVARVFSDCAELRAQRRGDARLTLLLTEDEDVVREIEHSFAVNRYRFDVEEGHRILVGKKPQKPVRSNSDALIEVAYPRELDYDIAPVGRDQVLAAEVVSYYDNMSRLKFVRYRGVVASGTGTIGVKPYV